MQIPSADPVLPAVFPRATSPTASAVKLTLGLSVAVTALAALAYPFLQPVIPVFYTLPQPERQLAGKIWIFLFPLLAWLIALTHLVLLKKMKTVEGSVQRVAYWTTTGLVAIIALLLVRVILIVL